MFVPYPVKDSVQRYIAEGMIPKQIPVTYKYEHDLYYLYVGNTGEFLVFRRDGTKVEGKQKENLVHSFMNRKTNSFIRILKFVFGLNLWIMVVGILGVLQQEAIPRKGKLFFLNSDSYLLFSMLTAIPVTCLLWMYGNPRRWKLYYLRICKPIAHLLLIVLAVILPFLIFAFDCYDLITDQEIAYSNYLSWGDRHEFGWDDVRQAELEIYKYSRGPCYISLMITMPDGYIFSLKRVSDSDNSEDVRKFLHYVQFVKQKNIPIKINPPDPDLLPKLQEFPIEIQKLFSTN